MRLTETLQQWLINQEWEDQPDINEEEQTSSTHFGFTVEDVNLGCFFDIMEKGQLFKLYMYCNDVKVPEKRMEEMQKFVCQYNTVFYMGQLQLNPETRVLRYYNAIDVEDAAFEPQHISNILNGGIAALRLTLPKYMAICFAGKTAEEVMAEE